MHQSARLFTLLVVLVVITFSVIGYIYYDASTPPSIFFTLLALSVFLLLGLFIYQRRIYNRVIDKMTLDINRDWLQGLFSYFPNGMLILDSAGKVLFSNQFSENFFGLSQEDIKDKSIAELFTDQALQFYLEAISADSGSQWREEFLLENGYKHFTWVALSVSYQPLTNTGDNVWSLIYEDITAKRVLRDKLDRVRTEQALILDNTTLGLALVKDRQIVRTNNALAKLLGTYTSSIINKPWLEAIRTSSGGADILDEVVEKLTIHSTYETELKLLKEDGTSFWCRISARAASSESTASGIIFSFKDASGSREQDDELRKAAVVFEASSDAIMVLDADGLVRMVNTAFTKMTGFTENDIIGKSPRLLRGNRKDENRYDAMWQTVLKKGHWRGELWRRKKSGETYPEWTSVTAVKDSNDQVLEYVIIGSDMSDRKYAEDRILYQANFDQLTNLPNRNLFMDRLHQSLQRVQRDNTVLALLFIDLDRFKNINDSLGHSAGDKLLKKVSEEMRKAIRESDTIARFGGDEFAVILSPIYGPKNASRVAQALLEVLANPIDLDGYKAIIGASIGISLYPSDGTTEEELVKNADTAMYRAKESGRNNYQFFTDEMQQAAKDRLLMENDLRDAIDRQELSLVYQPQVDAKTNKLAGAEVLVRWQNSKRGMVSPADFIYLAEDTGLIVSIGEWVLRQACLQYGRWQRAGVAPPYLAINVSGRQFKMDGFSESVRKILEDTGLESEYVELELTESFLMDDQEFAINTLQELKSMGFQLSIDDFGTGYSSLSYLKKFPIDRLKIDRSFVVDIDTNEEDRAIVRAIIDLAHTLNISVIAEGVEEETQNTMLTRMGCDIIQGYYHSKPIDGVAFTLYLQKYNKSETVDA
jgi:diguanylate cyclase (GGDEF)-like protein/PAS domain S-box-containing protein